MPTVSMFLRTVLLMSSIVLGHRYFSPQSSGDGDSGTEQITCFEEGSGFVTTAEANDLVNKFNRLICQTNPDAGISLNPLEGITVEDLSGTIIFQDTLDQVATPPNCGEVVDDFRKLVAACFADQESYGGVLVETAGGGATNYIIESPAREHG